MRNPASYEVQILQSLYKEPRKSRSDLSQELRLNKSSVSEYINQLLDKKIILEKGMGDSTTKGGRRPISLEINYRYGLFLGIDVAPDQISYALCDLELKMVDYQSQKLLVNRDNVLTHSIQIIETALKKASPYRGGLLGVAFSIHGIVDGHTIRFTPNYNIYKGNLYQEIRARYPFLPVHLINESNASALCESYSSHIRNLVAVNVGRGLGAGIIVEGQLIHGVNGYAGEIGHVVIMPGGRKCNCGNRGCFEQYCADESLVEYYNTLSDRPIHSILELIDRHQSGDEYAEKAIAYNLKYMALLMNHIMKMTAPEVIVINSDLAYYLDSYIDQLQNMTSMTYKQNIVIKPSLFHHRSVLLGDIYLAITEFLKNYQL